MPTYLSPGVYVEETSAGARPIEGVGTAVAAFVGLASAGPYNTPTLVTNWSQFTKIFGDFVEGTYLHHSVYGYFQNGGGACYIVRVGGNGASAPVARAELTAAAGGGGAAANVGAFRVQALSEGAEGNDISVEIADSAAEGAPEDAFKLIVKKGDKVEETFDNVTTKKGRQNVVNVVNAQSKLVRLEDLGVSAEKVSR
ncbi:MAG TPA: hypothetical protein VFJ79_05640, partial [Acidimicrobiales bacterium]|nr:hypothetical protein [Acidimicrobiales bacterium]